MGRVETLLNPTPAPAVLQAEDVKAIRYKLNQSQADFALMIGVTLATLQGWEEGRHHPDGPAQALLRVAAKNPRIVAKALGRA
jgi:putative transcriptional regulator